MTDIYKFFCGLDLFFANVVLSINRTHEDTLLTYLVQIGQETAGRRRKKIDRRKINITKDLKLNVFFAKMAT